MSGAIDNDAIQRLMDAASRATPGRRRWIGNMSGKSIELCANGNTVMAFRRWGMQRAKPSFNTDGLLTDSVPLFKHPQSHNYWMVVGIDHPDAEFMEACDAGTVRALCEEVIRLRALHDMAVPS